MDNHLLNARRAAELLDSRYSFLGIRFGLDPILDLVPGLGDILGLLLSAYLLWIAVQMGVSRRDRDRMLGNILIDFLIGALPILGPIGDLYFKANLLNLAILEGYRIERPTVKLA